MSIWGVLFQQRTTHLKKRLVETFSIGIDETVKETLHSSDYVWRLSLMLKWRLVMDIDLHCPEYTQVHGDKFEDRGTKPRKVVTGETPLGKLSLIFCGTLWSTKFSAWFRRLCEGCVLCSWCGAANRWKLSSNDKRSHGFSLVKLSTWAGRYGVGVNLGMIELTLFARS